MFYHLSCFQNYLAMHSPFFNSLFYREFVEKDKKEIEMPDVKYEDAINLLEVGSYHEIQISHDNF